MDTELLNKLDAAHILKFKLSENPEFSITQNYICELFDIIEYYKTINRLNVDECDIITEYITTLYIRIKESTSIKSEPNSNPECTCNHELKPYSFCFYSSKALIKCKNFQIALTYIPLLELFLVYTTDFYKDVKTFQKPNIPTEKKILNNHEMCTLLSNIFDSFNNYNIRSKFIIMFIIIELNIYYELYINKKMPKVLIERIGEIKAKISTNIEFRILFHDIITRCKLSNTILDEWLIICQQAID
jgi:hypothetical protein